MCPRCVHCFVSLLLQKLANFPLTWFLTSPSIRYPYCPGFFHSPFHSSLHGPQGPQVKRLKFEITYIYIYTHEWSLSLCVSLTYVRAYTCKNNLTVVYRVNSASFFYTVIPNVPILPIPDLRKAFWLWFFSISQQFPSTKIGSNSLVIEHGLLEIPHLLQFESI